MAGAETVHFESVVCAKCEGQGVKGGKGPHIHWLFQEMSHLGEIARSHGTQKIRMKRNCYF